MGDPTHQGNEGKGVEQSALQQQLLIAPHAASAANAAVVVENLIGVDKVPVLEARVNHGHAICRPSRIVNETA